MMKFGGNVNAFTVYLDNPKGRRRANGEKKNKRMRESKFFKRKRDGLLYLRWRCSSSFPWGNALGP